MAIVCVGAAPVGAGFANELLTQIFLNCPERGGVEAETNLVDAP